MKTILCALAIGSALLGCSRSENRNRPKARGAAQTATAEAAPPRTEVGDAMPAYSAKLLDGRPFDLAAEKGNVVFVNVWATWCGPCRFEIPELQALQRRYGGSGLKVVGISVDEGDPGAVKSFAETQKITYDVATDPEGRIASLVQTTVLPTSILIDRNGTIAWRQIGAIMPNDTKLKAAIEKALAPKRG